LLLRGDRGLQGGVAVGVQLNRVDDAVAVHVGDHGVDDAVAVQVQANLVDGAVAVQVGGGLHVGGALLENFVQGEVEVGGLGGLGAGVLLGRVVGVLARHRSCPFGVPRGRGSGVVFAVSPALFDNEMHRMPGMFPFPEKYFRNPSRAAPAGAGV